MTITTHRPSTMDLSAAQPMDAALTAADSSSTLRDLSWEDQTAVLQPSPPFSLGALQALSDGSRGTLVQRTGAEGEAESTSEAPGESPDLAADSSELNSLPAEVKDALISLDNSIQKSLRKDYKKDPSKWSVLTNRAIQSEKEAEKHSAGQAPYPVASPNPEAEAAALELVRHLKLAFPKKVNERSLISPFHRTLDKQAKLFLGKLKEQGGVKERQQNSALPGFSQHHTGNAIDLFSVSNSWWNHPISAYIIANAPTFGFEVSYPAATSYRTLEPWHVCFCSAPNSAGIQALDQQVVRDALERAQYSLSKTATELGMKGQKKAVRDLVSSLGLWKTAVTGALEQNTHRLDKTASSLEVDLSTLEAELRNLDLWTPWSSKACEALAQSNYLLGPAAKQVGLAKHEERLHPIIEDAGLWREVVTAALQDHRNNLRKAAKSLKMKKEELQQRMVLLGLQTQ